MSVSLRIRLSSAITTKWAPSGFGCECAKGIQRERLESFLIFAFVCFLLLALGVGIGTIVSFLLDLLH